MEETRPKMNMYCIIPLIFYNSRNCKLIYTGRSKSMYAWKLGVGRDEKKRITQDHKGTLGVIVMFMALIVIVVYGCMHMLKLVDIIHLNF